MVGDIADYKSRNHFTGEIRDGQRVHTTPHTVAELKRRIAKADQLIAVYETRLGSQVNA
jgi:hypothetical protein